MPAANETLVPLAVIIGAHGLRGELRVKPYNPSSDLLLSLTRAVLRSPGNGVEREVALVSSRRHGQGLLVVLEGCADRNAAIELRGAELCVPRERMPALADGEYYLIDLSGLTARRPDGQVLGSVEEALEYPASQVLRVTLQDGSGAIEIPLVAPYVVDIRLDERIVIVDHLDDLEVEPPRPRRR
jgi:16S rRNA processing protein RimM